MFKLGPNEQKNPSTNVSFVSLSYMCFLAITSYQFFEPFLAPTVEQTAASIFYSAFI